MDSPCGATLRWGMDPIVYERRGAAALVRIVRPERRNAIDGATADALHAAFARFVADEGARVLVLAGDANAFSAGADLKAIETLRDRDEGPLGITRLHSPKPTIAAVTGYCVGCRLYFLRWWVPSLFDRIARRTTIST